MKGKLLWIFQVVPSLILLGAAYEKLSSSPSEVRLFSALEMEPTGRFIIGIIEGIAALLLLSPHYAAAGALLALGTMTGALIAHITVIGFDLKHTLLLSAVLFSSLIVLIARYRYLPLLGPRVRD